MTGISYQTALELKDAGFPQKGRWGAVGPHGDWVTKDGLLHDALSEIRNEIPLDALYRPTLSELIEACGGGIFQLLRQSEWHTFKTGAVWQAVLGKPNAATSLTVKGIKDSMTSVYGSTPEESVARLWLAINKK